ncbi:hypothetical protein KJ877_02790 [bacterium]|nr:hypothetical protein [bacterium]MBU1990162.1 hypothetical protein [bacterium]
MKFTIIKDLSQDSMMKPILSGLLLFTILYLLSDIIVKHNSFGVLPNAIEMTLFGNEEEFLEGMGKTLFLEFWHVEIFFIMMVVFISSTIYTRLSNASKSAVVIVNIMMISSMISLISLPIAYFLSSYFISVYAVTFFIWHFLALYISLFSIKRLYYA